MSNVNTSKSAPGDWYKRTGRALRRKERRERDKAVAIAMKTKKLMQDLDK